MPCNLMLPERNQTLKQKSFGMLMRSQFSWMGFHLKEWFQRLWVVGFFVVVFFSLWLDCHSYKLVSNWLLTHSQSHSSTKRVAKTAQCHQHRGTFQPHLMQEKTKQGYILIRLQRENF